MSKPRTKKPHNTPRRSPLLAVSTGSPILQASTPTACTELGNWRWGLAARLPRWSAFDGRRSRVSLN